MSFLSIYLVINGICIILVALYLIGKCIVIGVEKLIKHIKLVRASYKCGKKCVRDNPNINY